MNSVGLQILAAALALPGVDGAFAKPYSRDFRLSPGEKWLTGDAQIVGFYVDSNDRYAIAEYTGIVLYYLSDPTDSDTYRQGEMLDDLKVMLDRQSASGFSGVVEALEPRISKPLTRIGNVMEYEVTTPIVLESVS